MIRAASLLECELETDRPINVASVPQRSPFRYPGGKTWFAPYVRRWLRTRSRHCQRFIEPFAGGAIIGLTVAFDELANHVYLVELDKGVAAVWKTILGGKATELAKRIRDFKTSIDTARGLLDSNPRASIDRAFQTLVRNRLQHGGILAPGASLMRKGENGKGPFSRWYPDTLRRRILDIQSVRNRITFTFGDAFDFIGRYRDDTRATWFLDPPYTVAGKRLYTHSEIDHDRLFSLARSLKGEFLMTYDDSAEIRNLAAAYRFEAETIAMQTRQLTAKTELLISRDLSWLRS